MFKILRIRLTENDCRNRGYILDGFPKTYKQAQEVFLYKPKKFDENGEEIQEDEPELEEGEEKSFDGFVIRQEIFPKSVIVLDTSDDSLLYKRIRDTKREQEIAGTHYNAEDMQRRIAAYRKANNSVVAEPSLKQFFQEQGVTLHEQSDCINVNADQALKSFKIYIERFEKPFNYMTYDDEEERKHVVEQKRIHVEIAEKDKAELEREEIVEREIRRQKEQYTKHRLEQIKEYERDVLDAKSQPIRQYLMDNLVPILTDGLLEICKRTPQDPVDFLAEYLFRRSLDVPYPDPTNY